MNTPQTDSEKQRSDEDQPHSNTPSDEVSEAGLTDDERVSREGESVGDGARVKPGPADLERLPKP